MGLPEKIQFLLDEHRLPEFEISGMETIPDCDPAIIKGLNRFFSNKLAQEGIKSIKDLSNMTPRSLTAIDDDSLRQWIMIAKILCTYADFEDAQAISEKRRIVLTGIDQAGKTSTLKSLQNMKTMPETRPTPGVAAEKLLFLGHHLSVFDLGGQMTFRGMYLSSPEDYFSETMLLIFVVDVQTYSRASEAISYFTEILDVLDVLGERPLISIHLHKFDSDADKTLEANASHLRTSLEEVLKEKGWTNVFYFKTTIFEIQTIVNAISTVFRAISPMSQVLHDTLKYYSEFHGLQGAFLVTKRGMLITEYVSRLHTEDKEQMFEEVYNEIINSADKIMEPAERVFGEAHHQERYVFRSYPTGTYISITPLSQTDQTGEADLFLAMLSQDIEKTPVAFSEDFYRTIDLWLRFLFIPPSQK
ncbi:MAG: ADP-ribosylation factor-like protein [Candidatus Thorarchaeota archaeon]